MLRTDWSKPEKSDRWLRVFDRHIRLALRFLAGDPSTPAGLPIKAQLQYYASQFETAELKWSVLPNAHAGRRKELERSRPVGDFVYTWKGVQIHHPLEAALGETPSTALNYWKSRLSFAWRPRPVPVSFFNLPPNFKADVDRLSFFLRIACRGKGRLQFRIPSPELVCTHGFMRVLSKGKHLTLASPTTHDGAGALENGRADFAYVRGHGPGGSLQGGAIRRVGLGRIGPSAIKSWKIAGVRTCLCSSITIRRALHRSMRSS